VIAYTKGQRNERRVRTGRREGGREGGEGGRLRYSYLVGEREKAKFGLQTYHLPPIHKVESHVF
jgi:hypothetical protein